MLEGETTYGVSNYPISTRQALKAVRENEVENARNDLRLSKDPYEALMCYHVSVADIERIAKEEGIALPDDWFEIAEEEIEAANAEAARAEVARLEGLLAAARRQAQTAQAK